MWKVRCKTATATTLYVYVGTGWPPMFYNYSSLQFMLHTFTSRCFFNRSKNIWYIYISSFFLRAMGKYKNMTRKTFENISRNNTVSLTFQSSELYFWSSGFPFLLIYNRHSFPGATPIQHTTHSRTSQMVIGAGQTLSLCLCCFKMQLRRVGFHLTL